MPPLIDRLAAHLQAEAGHEAGTARDVAANTVRKWWETRTDHLGGGLSRAVVEAARADIVEFERAGDGKLSEAAALGRARGRAGGKTMRKAERRSLSDKLGHRATIAEGLLLAGGTELARSAAEKLLGGSLNGGMAAALRSELVLCRTLREGLGYARHPVRGERGQFHGMHGRERAAKKGGLLPGAGTVACPECGAPRPGDSSCPSCGYVPGGGEEPDVLAKLAEATAVAAKAAPKAAAPKPVAPAAEPAKPQATAGGELGAKFGAPAAEKTPKPKAAPEPERPKGRAGEPVANQEFEQAHPRSAKGRTGGGRWIQKGVGMQQGPSSLVRQAQQRLAEIDPKYTTNPDGRFGDNTEQQVKMFQRDMGLPESGELDPATVEAMRNPPRNADGSLRSAGGAAGAGAASASGGAGPGGAAGAGTGTGMPDPSDPEAIKSWQQQHGLPESGLVDKATQAAMRAVKSATSRAGAQGQGAKGQGGGVQMVRRGDGMSGQPDAAVTKLQQNLDDLGYDLGNDGVDGRFGEGTDKAIRKLQQRYGLRVDGVAGPQTLDLLDRLSKQSAQGKAPGQWLTEAGLAEAVAGALVEATHVGVTTKPYGGIVPLALGVPQLVAAVEEKSGGINFRSDMTEGAKMEVRQRLEEARAARVAAEKSGDTTAWARARERELAALSEVKSSAYPGLDRSPKKNWVDKAGGLPSYIERIAKHLHYEKGMDIGRAIATAVNAVKKMCAGGDTNFPGKQNVNPKSRAEACAAVASWEKKKGKPSAAGLAESADADEFERARELVEALPTSERFHPSVEQAFNIARDAEEAERRAGRSYLEVSEAPAKKGAAEPGDSPAEDDAELMAMAKKFMDQGMPRDAAMKAAKKALAAKQAGEGE